MSGPKLSDYEPGIANVKISIVALWEQLRNLEAVAEDPAKVKAWGKQLRKELELCEVCEPGIEFDDLDGLKKRGLEYLQKAGLVFQLWKIGRARLEAPQNLAPGGAV